MSIQGKTVLVTGGTGSFGNFIVKRLMEHGAKEIRIYSRDEKKQYDMKIHYKHDPRLRFFIGDIRDFDRLNEAIRNVQIVYQAAALKQVPACETSPYEAVKTNVIGVDNLVRAALMNNVEKVVVVSTDKAVKPVNVMGMTKALQERLALSANQSPMNAVTKLCVVRYGNVMQSRGSVIPFFRRLLDRGEQLTITDEKMTRFLLTLEDAIDLVMFATEHMNGGETFVKKAPAANIVDMAQVLSKMHGSELNYRVIGKFPGEKIHEILITEEELQRTQDMGDYFKVSPSWEPRTYTDLVQEYDSGTEVTKDEDEIKHLIGRSDKEFETVSLEAKVFSKL